MKDINKLSEDELLVLVAPNPSLFWSEEAKRYRDTLRRLIMDHRQRIPKVKRLQYALQLIITCPHLLDKPSDFEFVVEDLKRALFQRMYDPEVDRKFWEALETIRGKLRTGAPSKRSRDYVRANLVEFLMSMGNKKSQAVEKLAVLEDRSGDKSDTRGIWRSLQRVKKEGLWSSVPEDLSSMVLEGRIEKGHYTDRKIKLKKGYDHRTTDQTLPGESSN